MKWSSTKTCIGPATSEDPKAFSSVWPSKSADVSAVAGVALRRPLAAPAFRRHLAGRGLEYDGDGLARARVGDDRIEAAVAVDVGQSPDSRRETERAGEMEDAVRIAGVEERLVGVAVSEVEAEVGVAVVVEVEELDGVDRRPSRVVGLCEPGLGLVAEGAVPVVDEYLDPVAHEGRV